jgi:PAS domain S-box-containing protein
MVRKLNERFDLRLSLIYAAATTLWFLLSDSILSRMFAQSPAGPAAISTGKWLVFVVITTFALFVVTRAELQKRERVEAVLQDKLSEQAHDIREREKRETALRESEASFRHLADTAPAMLWVSDPDGEITFPSRGWLIFTGQTEADARGWGWLNALHPEDREPIKNAYLEVIESPAFFQFEYRLLHQPDGDYRSAIATGNPRFSANGEFLGFIGSVIDVTEHEIAQRELRAAERLRMELETEKELLQLKERFISVVSHEFRTPLAVIISSTELVHRFYEQMPRERQLEHLQVVLIQSEFMVELLDNLLTVNKARSGKLEFNPTTLNLNGFCQTTLERMRALDKSKHEFVFTTEGDLSKVVLDTKLLQHILVNLLSNAAKYSPEGGQVWLEAKRLNDEVELRVSDRGIGIPAEGLTRLFEPFYRANNTGEIGGTGLGLTIVKESVDLHKGTITCESTVGVGTTFAVRLPAAPAQPVTEV